MSKIRQKASQSNVSFDVSEATDIRNEMAGNRVLEEHGLEEWAQFLYLQYQKRKRLEKSGQ